ncbi:IS110 family transposase [Enterobacter asburiae]|nr:IS110 family transposase [Enterobacter asburiae]
MKYTPVGVDIPGGGPQVTTAAIAILDDAGTFRSGREFVAYIGLVPKQTGTGGKVRLLGISKRGDAYSCWQKIQIRG